MRRLGKVVRATCQESSIHLHQGKECLDLPNVYRVSGLGLGFEAFYPMETASEIEGCKVWSGGFPLNQFNDRLINICAIV